ncbi:hypothetical protein [Pedobacter psychroterrae]|uniref:Parallel beta helix pectate lyase-like protein n=1 Tax=Pedobacter psychroterrae TaxID=2530453 RepID=A0A4R0NM21_9SPHI|nr:hypothetical protein [Pedobacter psychroterrae]TCD01706.1 hypothetical protein EZ437_13395 [Pedobacter psychroterrae]
MKLYLYFLFALVFMFFSTCKKKPLKAEYVTDKDTVEEIQKTHKIIEVGTGDGNLVIDGSGMSLNCNDTIRIAKGSYNSINIKNIKSRNGCTVTIINTGLVEINGNFKQMNLQNLRGVNITGNGDPNIKYGFQFHDNIYRSVVISKPYSRATLQYASFKNIFDYVITFNESSEYDGTENSYAEDLKFLSISCENTATLLRVMGNVENNKIVGYIKGLEIAYLDYRNSEVGDIINVGNVEDYDIHHNRVMDINRTTNTHNGVFHCGGNGKFHDNFISNHSGNALRAWMFTLGSRPKNVLIYNNIVVNSRKYSAFETQSFSFFMGPKVTYANAQVYNNTCGNLNISKDWYGNVVDVYNLQGGYCKVFNNLAFNFPAPNPADKIINQQSSTTPQNSNNLYFNTAAEVGFSDQTTYTLTTSSAAKNKGLPARSLLEDFYGQSRSRTKPSIGAVE